MRIWSLHPRHLDRPGLLGLWRETLLALAVLRGVTVGYRKHPQIDRWRPCPRALGEHGLGVAAEMRRRGYRPDEELLQLAPGRFRRPTVTAGQLELERRILARKLAERGVLVVRGASPVVEAVDIRTLVEVEPHPLFVVVDGGVEPWERATMDM